MMCSTEEDVFLYNTTKYIKSKHLLFIMYLVGYFLQFNIISMRLVLSCAAIDRI